MAVEFYAQTSTCSCKASSIRYTHFTQNYTLYTNYWNLYNTDATRLYYKRTSLSHIDTFLAMKWSLFAINLYQSEQWKSEKMERKSKLCNQTGGLFSASPGSIQSLKFVYYLFLNIKKRVLSKKSHMNKHDIRSL